MVAEKILEIVKQKGPVQPARVARELKTTILIASACLAELAEKNMVRASYLKIGGLPLYFCAGQEDKLEDFVEKLSEKERTVFWLLKGKKVLFESELEASQKNILQHLKDFAEPIEIKNNGKNEKAWKWHLVTESELNLFESEKAKDVKKLVKEILEEPSEQDSSKLLDELNIKKIDAEQKKDKRKPALGKEKNSDFLIKVENYLKKNNIEVVEKTIVKNNRDADFVVKIPTPVGSVSYYCKAKSKKIYNDSDISTVFVNGQLRKLPVLFLVSGDLSKKAKAFLQNPEFKNIQIAKIN